MDVIFLHFLPIHVYYKLYYGSGTDAIFYWLRFVIELFLYFFIFLFIAELLLTSPLSAVMALGSLSNWLTNFIIGMIFPIMKKYIGPFAFIPFAVVCIYGFLLTYWYLPETRNRSPDEVAPLLEKGFKSKIK